MKPRRRLRPYNRARLWFVVGCFGLSFAAIFSYLYSVQIIRHADFKARARRQYMRQLTLRPERGRILDRQGGVLASSISVPSLFAAPDQVEQPEAAAVALAEVLGQPSKQLRRQLTSNKSFVWLARQVAPEVAAKVRALALPGIHVQYEMRRYYPKRHLAGQVLGFVGIDGHGLGGLEYQYDRALFGQPRQVTLRHDAVGRQVGLGSAGATPPPRGADIQVTLDEWLQHLAEREIAHQVETLEARGGLVLVVQPRTGDILAMASYPFFNPNDYRNNAQYAWRRNRTITDPVEPGSTFKLVVAAASLEEHTVQPEEQFFCENGVLRRGRRRIRDHHPYAWLTFHEVFEHSSNICTIKISERLSSFRLYQYIRRFGFGEQSFVELPGESAGQLRPPSEWSGFSHDSLSIGQEIAVTPLQLIMAYAAVANGGVLMRPRIVRRIAHGSRGQALPPYERWRVLSPSTAEHLKAILRGVVLRGTGKRAAIEGYAVAGKTGTAQKVEPGHGYYSHRRVVASFVGFVPLEEPQLAILVMLDEPRKTRWGGTAAAPVFQRIAQQALRHLQIPPQLVPPLATDSTVKQAVGHGSKPADARAKARRQLAQTRR
jgi:cell division protein FtsI (penicillin-binding protein 3)